MIQDFFEIEGGVQTSAEERDIPYRDKDTQRRGDLITKTTGAIPVRQGLQSCRSKVVMDVKLGHIFTTTGHKYKPDNLSHMEQEKRRKYREGYNAQKIICSSGGKLLGSMWA